MHPALIAYQSQLMFNQCICDVYIRPNQGFNSTTGVVTGGKAVPIRGILGVRDPSARTMKSGPGGSITQVISLSVTFPIMFLNGATLKLNDFIVLSVDAYGMPSERYEIKNIVYTGGILVTLGLFETTGQVPQVQQLVQAPDSITWTDAATVTVE